MNISVLVISDAEIRLVLPDRVLNLSKTRNAWYVRRVWVDHHRMQGLPDSKQTAQIGWVQVEGKPS